MANPGYPMQPMGPGGMPPGGMGPNGMGPGMGGPPSQQMNRPPMRQGTSKAVPVVVSAGLAVGVFCGLLFGLGTGDPVAAAPSTGTNKVDKVSTDTTDTTTGETKIDQSVVGIAAKSQAANEAAAKAEAAAGSGSAQVAMTGSGSAAPTVPAVPVHPKLTVELSPASVAATATITVDGKPVTGSAYEVDLAGAPKKEVSVVVKAKDYKDIEQKVTVDGDVTLKLELLKRTSRPSVGAYTPPKTGGTSTTTKKTGKKKPDNQIDI